VYVPEVKQDGKVIEVCLWQVDLRFHWSQEGGRTPTSAADNALVNW